MKTLLHTLVILILFVPIIITAQTNYSLSFDGNDDYVSIANESNFDFTTAMTVEAWIKISSFNTSYAAIVTKGDNSWRLHRSASTNYIGFGTNFGPSTWNDLEGKTNVNNSSWHHVAAVFNGSTKYIYIDGVLDNSVSASGSLQNSSYSVNIGANSQASGRYFNGQIDEVRIWNVARTQTEIQNNMNTEIATHANLIAYYKMSDGSGTTLTDNSGNNNNGTIYGGATWVTSEAPLPVELNSLVANREGSFINLNWQTATEVNNYGFDVECRSEGKVWRTIGFVPGNGNSNSLKKYSFTDKNPTCGKLNYRLKQIDFDGSFEYSQVTEVFFELPNKIVLEQNHPNPFNPTTSIKFEIPSGVNIKLAVYDILGREISELVNGFKAPGTYEVEFNANGLSNGVYFYNLIAGQQTITRKLVLLK